MTKLIDYTKVKTTEGLFKAHLMNSRLLVSDTKLVEKESLKRFGNKNEESVMTVFKEANDTLTVARRHGLNAGRPLGTHKGKKYGIIRGRVMFIKGDK